MIGQTCYVIKKIFTANGFDNHQWHHHYLWASTCIIYEDYEDVLWIFLNIMLLRYFDFELTSVINIVYVDNR